MEVTTENIVTVCEGGRQARLCARGPTLDPALRPGLDRSLSDPCRSGVFRG